MKKLWFKAKDYGWGWYPSTWQGWLILATWIALAALDFRMRDFDSHSASDTLINFVPDFLFLSLILIYICWKTGEKPEWRWGGKSVKK